MKKKFIGYFVIAFVAFWLFSDPDGLGNSANLAITNAWNVIKTIFVGLMTFFRSFS
ncbi:MAG: hypothetical protein ACRCYQ_16395 [Nocardioides sp.]